MINNIPKVTIYRLNKYTPGSRFLEVMIQFRNPNIGQALVSFLQLNEEQLTEMQEKDTKSQLMRIELPRSEFKIDPSENFLESVTQSITGSIAESNNTNVKALVAVHDEDQRFVYKKMENAVIL